MTGIYLIIPGECGEPFQGFFDIIPIAGGEVCSAAGALKQGIAAENDILADKADGAYGMSGVSITSNSISPTVTLSPSETRISG